MCTFAQQGESAASKRGRAKNPEEEAWHEYLLSDEDANHVKHVRKAKDRHRNTVAKNSKKPRPACSTPLRFMLSRDLMTL